MLFLKCFNDMRKYILLLQIANLIFSFASCQNIHKSTFLKNDYVIKDSVFYEFDTIKHFTLIEMGGDVVDRQYPYFTDEFEVLCRWKVYQCNDLGQMQRFQDQCLQSAAYFVSPNDSLFFTFDNERYLKFKYDTIMLDSIFENIIDCGHLIPNFKNVFDFRSNGTKHYRFPSDSIVFYVMKFGNSFILPQDYEYNWNLLPDRIRHGYNSGIAFDKNTSDCFYSWAIAW